ncbi:hypothetical protein IRY61_03090 [Candidatus Saccharibacteria bacterium]|nr:hypothetical protein [Candidatus Saccharibacteria bacterium]
MRVREPSPIDRFFETPPHERPALGLDLPLSPDLQEEVWRIGSGGTRWADLIIGFSMDDAGRQGVEPARIRAALEAGEIVMETFYFLKFHIRPSDDPDRPPFGYDSEARLAGKIAARASLLKVEGGDPFGLPFSVEYQKRDNETYVPARSTYVTIPLGDGLSSETVEIPESYAYNPDDPESVGYYGVPDKLRAAAALGHYADIITEELDAGRLAVRSNITFVREREIRGRGRYM